MVAPSSAARVREVVDPAVRGAGLLLEDLEVVRAGARSVVRVVVDVDDADAELDLDRVGEVTRVVSDALDASDAVHGHYTLEVSSPGVDRPLTQPRHWRRATGRLVVLERTDGTSVRGRLREVGAGDAPTLVVVPLGVPAKGRPVREGAPVEVVWADVRAGRVEVDMSGLGPADDDGPGEG